VLLAMHYEAGHFTHNMHEYTPTIRRPNFCGQAVQMCKCNYANDHELGTFGCVYDSPSAICSVRMRCVLPLDTRYELGVLRTYSPPVQEVPTSLPYLSCHLV
jgi:hypothetical protein